jgi:hypothetical protein
MDMIFVPVASIVGASLDQVKVCKALQAPAVISLTITLIAHIMSSNIIPSRKSIHSYTVFPTRLKAYI